ncbi:MAG: InlB B-repeat-containing protein, partial [Eubacterium sp.]
MGTFTMTDGTIKNCSATTGGGVVTGSTFTMNGGVIDNCKADDKGGGVTVTSGSNTTATFTLDGGTIKNCSATFGGGVANGYDSLFDSYFTMKSGSIDNCQAKKVGGGVYNEDYTVSTMSGGTIKNCVAYCGGGVGVSRNASYDRNSGSLILENSASNELSKFNMSGGTIENCKAIDYNDDGKYSIGCGGGVFAFYGKFTMTDGTIKNCTASDSRGDAIWLFTNADMIADGGSVYGKCFVDDHFFDSISEITNTDSSKYTKFYDLVENQGTISGGVFYGGITNTQNKNGVYGNVTSPYKIVYFDSNGGSAVPPQWLVNAKGATALKPTDPTRENYKFMGWYKDDNLYDFSTAVPENTIGLFTLKAKWVKTGVETEAELRTALDEGMTSIKLISDIQITSMLDLTNKVLTLDLNGHVLSAKMPLTDYIYLYVSKSPGALLTLEDSNPTATHKDSTLPLGGVLDCEILLGVADGCSYTTTLYADGGTVTKVVRLNHQNTSIMRSRDNNTTTTSFKNSVIGSGGHIF